LRRALSQASCGSTMATMRVMAPSPRRRLHGTRQRHPIEFVEAAGRWSVREFEPYRARLRAQGVPTDSLIGRDRAVDEREALGHGVRLLVVRSPEGEEERGLARAATDRSGLRQGPQFCGRELSCQVRWKHHEADRRAAEATSALMPAYPRWAREDRAFLTYVGRLWARQGRTRVLDLGSGLPELPPARIERARAAKSATSDVGRLDAGAW
jgi:hypothetical protein